MRKSSSHSAFEVDEAQSSRRGATTKLPVGFDGTVMELELQLETNTHDLACISTLLKLYQVSKARASGYRLRWSTTTAWGSRQ